MFTSPAYTTLWGDLQREVT
ncbi:hypothetical protein [Microbulbifer sp. PSTR4-B]